MLVYPLVAAADDVLQEAAAIALQDAAADVSTTIKIIPLQHQC